MTRCGECDGSTSWDDDVCSIICTSCGTLQDPSQSLLASHLDQHDNSARQYEKPLWTPSTTLKSIRGAGWNLGGQGKEARDSKNTVRIIHRLTWDMLLTFVCCYSMLCMTLSGQSRLDYLTLDCPRVPRLSSLRRWPPDITAGVAGRNSRLVHQ
jgi:hypothetical protein